MAIERIIDTKEHEDSDEKRIENSLRPQTFKEYIGQDRLKKHLKLAIEAAKKRNEPIDHVLLYGPAGLGKTTMASVIANEMGSSIRITAGPAIERAGDLASILTNLQDGDILFIDEIHRLSRAVEEVLYSAMEDYKLDIVIGKGPAARSVRLDLPKFTVIGATTRTGSLAAPLRDRFGIVHRLEFYNDEEISKIIERSASILNTNIDNEASLELANCSRGTPRVANRLLKRVRDFSQVKGNGAIDSDITRETLNSLGIDTLGLESIDRDILKLIITRFKGGPVGIDTIAAAIGEERVTIEDVYEPFLIQKGLLHRTQKGRMVSDSAYLHLGLSHEE